MCGIIGYVGSRRLEGSPDSRARAARVPRLRLGRDRAARGRTASTTSARSATSPNLKRAAGPNGSGATTGLGHTRWATHGGVNEDNAHPLTGCDERELAIVLNGIVENYRELKERARRPPATPSAPRPTPRSSRTCSRTRTTATSSTAVARGVQAARGPLHVRRRSTTTSRSGSSACATRRRSSSASARARTSSRRTSRRSSRRRGASSSRTTATSSR